MSFKCAPTCGIRGRQFREQRVKISGRYFALTHQQSDLSLVGGKALAHQRSDRLRFPVHATCLQAHQSALRRPARLKLQLLALACA